jgi:hypothetical protein
MRILRYRFLPAVAVVLIAVQAPAANGRTPYRLGVQETLHRVRADLNRAVQDTPWPTAGEARRFERVRHRVAEFQNRWDQGRLDHAALHALIEGLKDVVERNRLTSWDRMALRSDLERLRAVQDLYENYGYR